MKKNVIKGFEIGEIYPPLVVAEIGINHCGDINKAFKMIDDAEGLGCKCVKFQCFFVDDMMIQENIENYNMLKKYELNKEEHLKIKNYVESKNMIYLCTPFSKLAADFLDEIDIKIFKIGSGECNNYPLIEYIAKFKKPIILSTGMNTIASISESVSIFHKYDISYALLHCTSMYPTPYKLVRLPVLYKLKKSFPDAVLGISDHSVGNYVCFASIPYGVSILEKHFISTLAWNSPDWMVSITPSMLRDLVIGCNAIYKSLQGDEEIVEEEKEISKLAFSSIVTIRKIKKGEIFSENNIWVKRPGKGDFKAKDYKKILGKFSKKNIESDRYLSKNDIE